MLTEIQFKGLYTGRLTFVDHPQVIGLQIFGVLILQFKSELYAEQRVSLASMLKQARKEGALFSFILSFKEEVEFSSVDLTLFKDIHLLTLEWGVQFQIVCGTSSLNALSSFAKTANIKVYNSLDQALLGCKKSLLTNYELKKTRNIVVLEIDPQQRTSLQNALLLDRFSSMEASSPENALAYVKHFGEILDGAIIEFIYPDFKEEEILRSLKELQPNAKVLIHTAVLDPKILKICQQHGVTAVIKSPYKIQNIMNKFRNEFPERQENFLGFNG